MKKNILVAAALALAVVVYMIGYSVGKSAVPAQTAVPAPSAVPAQSEQFKVFVHLNEHDYPHIADDGQEDRLAVNSLTGTWTFDDEERFVNELNSFANAVLIQKTQKSWDDGYDMKFTILGRDYQLYRIQKQNRIDMFVKGRCVDWFNDGTCVDVVSLPIDVSRAKR